MKLAVLIAFGVGPDEARRKLAASRGNLRLALDGLGLGEEMR